MQKEIVPMKAQPVQIGAADPLLNLPAKLWRDTFINIHVKEPVTPRRADTLVALMAKILARKARR